jgi:uridine phosphorylase
MTDVEPLLDDGPVTAVRGVVAGAAVVAASTGMGGPAVAAVCELLADAGVDTFLRVGGAGPVADGVGVDRMIVATGAVRHEGTSVHFLPEAWPAVATPALVEASLRAARVLDFEVELGVVHTKDSFFGETDPGSSPVESEIRAAWSAWCRLGVLGSEMEAAPLFAMATRRGWRAGAVVKINDVDAPTGQHWSGDEDLCAFAVETLRELIGADRG